MDGAGQQPSYAELAALVVQLQATVARLAKRIDDLERENAGLKARVEELEAENAELRKKNPTKRLDKSYSMTAEEKRRQEAEQEKAERDWSRRTSCGTCRCGLRVVRLPMQSG